MHFKTALLLAVPGAVWATGDDSPSWKPAQETESSDKGAKNVQGWTPRPTDGPKPLFGRMDLARRLDGYTLGPATCGFVATDNDIIGCQTAGMTCNYQDGYAGCCVPNRPCTGVKKTCYDYSESLAGSCSSLTDYHTVCCGTRSMGGCFTWEVSVSSAPDRPSGVYTVFDCSTTAGKGSLLDYDPAWARTHSFASTTSSAPSPTQSDDAKNVWDEGNKDKDTDKKKTKVGAIAGGVVGGVAALALVGTAIFFFMRRKKNNSNNETMQNTSSSDPTSQKPYSPASSPAAYPSGNPSQYGYPPQQQYSPGPENYNNQQSPYSHGYQQQQWGPNPYGATSPSAISPGTHTSQSPPTFNTGYSPVGGTSASPPPQNASELGAAHPVGADTNRAELG